LLSHGTTVATNVVVERRGAKVGLITTAGHGDALLIMRAYGRAAGLSAAATLRFSATAKPEPLVPRTLIHEIPERIDSQGEVVVALDEAAVRRATRALLAAGVEAIAIVFLWSFRNPSHEQRALAIVSEEAPQLFVTASSDLAPLLGEYERAVATVMNCYVGPVTRRYVDRITARAAADLDSAPFLLMQCNGGLGSAESAKRSPLLLLQSGPCGGVVGAAYLGELLGFRNIIATDMGGTTFDVGLVHNGAPLRTTTTIVDQ
jgi:N-methylhydantoinase A